MPSVPICSPPMTRVVTPALFRFRIVLPEVVRSTTKLRTVALAAGPVTVTPLDVAIAINPGEVTVGSIGDPRHLAFTVLGDVVNVAARLEAEAKLRGARLLVTAPVRAAVPAVPAEALGAIELRGRVGAVEIHRLR